MDDNTGAALGLRTDAENASHIRRYERPSALRAENLRAMEVNVLTEEAFKNSVCARRVNRLHTTAPHHSLDSDHVVECALEGFAVALERTMQQYSSRKNELKTKRSRARPSLSRSFRSGRHARDRNLSRWSIH